MQGLAILLGALSLRHVPHWDAMSGAGNSSLFEGIPGKVPEVYLSCLFHQRDSMQPPTSRSGCDVSTLSTENINIKGAIIHSLLLPKIHYRIISLADDQEEVVVLKPLPLHRALYCF